MKYQIPISNMYTQYDVHEDVYIPSSPHLHPPPCKPIWDVVYFILDNISSPKYSLYFSDGVDYPQFSIVIVWFFFQYPNSTCKYCTVFSFFLYFILTVLSFNLHICRSCRENIMYSLLHIACLHRNQALPTTPIHRYVKSNQCLCKK